MKRVLLFILSLILPLILMSGCASRASDVTPVLRNITFDVYAAYYNESCMCGGEINSDGVLCLSVCEPESIAGMKLTVDGGSITAEYMGLTYTPKTDKMPFGGIAQLLGNVMTDAYENNTAVMSNDGEYYMESGQGEVYYKLTLAQTGLPIKLEIPSQGVIIEFRNIAIK